jgi:hypothetical protein
LKKSDRKEAFPVPIDFPTASRLSLSDLALLQQAASADAWRSWRSFANGPSTTK